MEDDTMTKEKTEVAVWAPKEFAGNDLLPYDQCTAVEEVEGIPQLVGREHVDPDDLILPSLSLLHGTSGAVQDGVEDAKPGVFMHSGADKAMPEGPIRLIFAHHHKGNALFPKDGDPRYNELKTCLSPDGVEGSEYGLCEECRKCLDWGANNEPPLGAQTHHFVAMTAEGPVMLRFSRSSYKAANQFISKWVGTSKNLWSHPVVVRVAEGSKTLASGKTTKYHHMQLAWQVTEKVPAELQRAAFALYSEVKGKHSTGNLRPQDEGGDELFDE